MPDFTPVPYGIQATIIGLALNGKRMTNVIAFKADTPLPTLAQVQAVANLVRDWVDSDYNACYCNQVDAINVHARSIAAEPGPEADAVPASGTGTLTGDVVPMSQTCVIQLHTGLTGQSHAGRLNTFQANENSQLNGLWLPAYVTVCELAMGALLAAVALTDFLWCVWSRTLLELFEITSVAGNVIPRTLRSREVDRGT